MKIPDTLTINSVQEFARDVYQQISVLKTGNWDLKGRRVIGAGKPIETFDYVRKADLDKAIASLSDMPQTLRQGLLQIDSPIRVGAFSTRGSAVAHQSELFIANDLDYIGWISTGGVWKYEFGMRAVTQANLSTFAANLGTDDDRLLVEITNYDHVLQWTGSAWTWGPGEVGSGYYQLFESAPSSAGANAWQVCDGTTVARLNADGTTTNVTVPDVSTAAYLKGGTSSAAVAAKGGHTEYFTATNQNESSHTHSFTATSGNDSGSQEVQSGTGVTVAAHPHTHSVSDTTAAGSAHTHTQDQHQHEPGDLELRNKQATLYFRR